MKRKCLTDLVFLLHLSVLQAFHLLPGVVHNYFSSFHFVQEEQGHPEAQFKISVTSKAS